MTASRRSRQEKPAGQPSQHPASARTPQQARRPAYVVVIAISPQMRQRYPTAPLSLDEALSIGRQQPEPEHPADADLEAEP